MEEKKKENLKSLDMKKEEASEGNCSLESKQFLHLEQPVVFISKKKIRGIKDSGKKKISNSVKCEMEQQWVAEDKVNNQ